MAEKLFLHSVTVLSRSIAADSVAKRRYLLLYYIFSLLSTVLTGRDKRQAKKKKQPPKRGLLTRYHSVIVRMSSKRAEFTLAWETSAV